MAHVTNHVHIDLSTIQIAHFGERKALHCIPYQYLIQCLCCFQYFRIFWLYSSLHNFAGIIKHNHTNWPIPWRTALGSIAQSTPALAAIDGPNRTEEMQETLRAELGDRLESVGRGASPENLERLLKETVIPYGDTLTVPIQSNALTPYLLATATVELCRAALGPLPSAGKYSFFECGSGCRRGRYPKWQW